MVVLPLPLATPWRPVRPPMSTSACGAASRSFIIGSRDWPPASSLASSPPACASSSRDSACSSDSARAYVKSAGNIVLPQVTGGRQGGGDDVLVARAAADVAAQAVPY